MFNLDSTYLDLLSSRLGKYVPHFLPYGFNRSSKILVNNTPWPLKDAIEDLNYIEELEKENRLVYKEFNKTSSMLLYSTKEKSKVAIVVAGGGYSDVCTFPESMPVAIKLHKMGFATLTFDYSTKDKAKSAIKELKDLIEYLTNNQDVLNIDMDNYMVIGFSAGGHLVASLGSSNLGYKTRNLKKPGLLGLCYPVISMKDEYAEIGTRRNLLGNNFTKEDIDEYSIEEHLDRDYPYSFIWTCKNDNVVPSANSYILAKRLADLGVPNWLNFYDSDVHGFGIGTNTVVEGWLDKLVAFYNEIY